MAKIPTIEQLVSELVDIVAKLQDSVLDNTKCIQILKERIEALERR